MTREWKRQGRWERDQEERKETEQEKDIGMTTKKRHTGRTHTEKEKKKTKDKGFGNRVHVYSVAQSCPTLWNPMDYSLPGSFGHEIFPVKNTGIGCHFFLQRIFLTQGSNLHLLPWQVGFLPLEKPIVSFNCVKFRHIL